MKTALLTLTILICAVCAGAQTRPRYAIDNFSTSNVTVKPLERPVMSPAKSAPKPLVKKTVQRSASVQDSYALENTAQPQRSLSSAKLSKGQRLSLSGNTTGDDVIDSYILDSCARYDIDPLLIISQMHQESSFKLRATSHKGASGLMQLMPATARRFGVTDIYDPQQNIEAGVKYMRWLLNTFNQDMSLALAGYNAGEGAVMKYGWGIPPYNETQNYVRKITARYQMLRGPYAMRMTATATAKAPEYKAATPVEKKVALSKYENPVYAVKTADGKMQLLNR